MCDFVDLKALAQRAEANQQRLRVSAPCLAGQQPIHGPQESAAVRVALHESDAKFVHPALAVISGRACARWNAKTVGHRGTAREENR